MNKARRMAALQSRALAAAGFAVLQIDLFGCGDSSGDFADASWAAWQQDVALAVQWLSEHATGGRIDLFGDLAQWFGGYTKAGLLRGAAYVGAGMKSLSRALHHVAGHA